MSSGATRHGDREITRGLIEALRPALRSDATALSRLAARDVAQLLGLTGLEAVLMVCDQHAGQARPHELQHVVERLERVIEDAADSGSLRSFVSVDRELAALASHLEQVEWEAPSAVSPPQATYSVAEQLTGLTLDDAEALVSARVSAPVAAALRAALIG